MRHHFSNKLIFGLAVLGFAGLVGFWLFISTVFLDEAGVDLTPPQTVSISSENKKIVHTIFVNASDNIFIDGKVFEMPELRKTMSSKSIAGKKQRIILRVDTDARHGILVEIKDALDELNYDVRIELMNTSGAGTK